MNAQMSKYVYIRNCVRPNIGQYTKMFICLNGNICKTNFVCIEAVGWRVKQSTAEYFWSFERKNLLKLEFFEWFWHIFRIFHCLFPFMSPYLSEISSLSNLIIFRRKFLKYWFNADKLDKKTAKRWICSFQLFKITFSKIVIRNKFAVSL